MEEHVEKHFRGKRILDINSRSLIDPDVDPPAPGVPPTVSNQGQSSVCASHAVGKGKDVNKKKKVLIGFLKVLLIFWMLFSLIVIKIKSSTL